MRLIIYDESIGVIERIYSGDENKKYNGHYLGKHVGEKPLYEGFHKNDEAVGKWIYSTDNLYFL